MAAGFVLVGAGAAGASTPPTPSLGRDAVIVHAGAAHPDSTGAIKNLNTGRCIDDSGAYGLRAFGCNGLNYQYWAMTGQSNGNWVLKNGNTGRCIDDSGAYGLRSFGCNGLNYQRWALYRNGNGSFTFKNENTGRCIDDSGAYGLRAFGCNGLNYQQFAGQ
ncbi:RICIN domain-containing protein [Streptomyces sp. NPDC058284]|uniref:RICIN domain-containing protein n=1 Tax=unclassified Streptomyces TaxID=2593676 RepID=UPI0036604432